jgi:hypothetical protein
LNLVGDDTPVALNQHGVDACLQSDLLAQAQGCRQVGGVVQTYAEGEIARAAIAGHNPATEPTAIEDSRDGHGVVKGKPLFLCNGFGRAGVWLYATLYAGVSATLYAAQK